MCVPETGSRGSDLNNATNDHAAESVLLILQGSTPDAHPGIVDGYERLRASGVVRHLSVFPVFGPNGLERGEAFWRDVHAQAHDQDATLVVFQYYHSGSLPDPRPAVAKLRTLTSSPSIVAALGDAFMNGYFGRPQVPRPFLQVAKGADLVTLTSMGALADYVAAHTTAPIMVLPNGACQVRFGALDPGSQDECVDADVAFVGSRNRSRNPTKGYFWVSRRRERLIGQLANRYGPRFALFGHGWNDLPSSRGPIPFQNQAKAVRCARVIFGGIPFSTSRYYTSNRPFIQGTSGVPIVDVAVPGVEVLLRDGEHWVLAGEEQVLSQVDEVLSRSSGELADIGRKASECILQRHTQAHRVATLIENVRRQRALRSGCVRVWPHMPFLLDDVDQQHEAIRATRNWYPS